MNKEQQIKIFLNTNEKLAKLLESKGNDYADTDRLINFKTLQKLCETLQVDVKTLEGVHMYYILLKIQRICNLTFNNKTAMNESTADSIDDLINYCHLMKCSLIEKAGSSENLDITDKMQGSGVKTI